APRPRCRKVEENLGTRLWPLPTGGTEYGIENVEHRGVVDEGAERSVPFQAFPTQGKPSIGPGRPVVRLHTDLALGVPPHGVAHASGGVGIERPIEADDATVDKRRTHSLD